ncbi:MAG: serine hydrolase domain-containing protein [Fuerstiella sp.]
MLNDFPSLSAAIYQGVERRLHTGVQVCVSVDGRSVLNAGVGMSTPDRPMTAHDIMLWRSAGKPLTAAAMCRFWQQGRVDLDQPIGTWLTEIQNSIVGRVTLKQILTHTSGLPSIETGWPHQPWEDILQAVYSVSDLTGSAAYQPQATWFLLGEILQRADADGRGFSQILTDDILQPLGLQETWCGLSPSTIDEHGHRLTDLVQRDRGALVSSDLATDPWLIAPSPGGNLRGPVSELARFYEMLLRNGKTERGDQLLHPDTVEAMTTRHRMDQFDETFQHAVDFGLGLIIDSNHHGTTTVPYGFGQFCSPRTFGHGGAQCAMGFCDPEHGLVVAWAANGFCGEGQHQRRNRAINEAIYRDLGLAHL